MTNKGNSRIPMFKTHKSRKKNKTKKQIRVTTQKASMLGGMTYKVYTKLYTSMVEPVLLYCSGIWGTKLLSAISIIQNRACKICLSVGKRTSNLASRGDMGWTSCFTKQPINYSKLLFRLLRLPKWTSRYKKGRAFQVLIC